jgi:hypothetical protein
LPCLAKGDQEEADKDDIPCDYTKLRDMSDLKVIHEHKVEMLYEQCSILGLFHLLSTVLVYSFETLVHPKFGTDEKEENVLSIIHGIYQT